MQAIILKILLALLGARVGTNAIGKFLNDPSSLSVADIVKWILAGGLEISAGYLDVIGYIAFISFILGSKKGGEKIAVVWPLSLILEVVSAKLWSI